MDHLEQLLTAQQLAAYLDVPIATVYRWRHRGEGPPGFRVGRHLRYRWTDVEGWIRFQLNATRSAALDHPRRAVGTGG